MEDYALFVDPTKSTVAPPGVLFDAALAIETIVCAHVHARLRLRVHVRLCTLVHAQNEGELLSSIMFDWSIG